MSEALVNGANPVAELLAGVRRRIVPEDDVPTSGGRAAAVPEDREDSEQWTELATAVDELVEVVLVQQDLIENLLLRMSRLEGRDVTSGTRRGA